MSRLNNAGSAGESVLRHAPAATTGSRASPSLATGKTLRIHENRLIFRQNRRIAASGRRQVAVQDPGDRAGTLPAFVTNRIERNVRPMPGPENLTGRSLLQSRKVAPMNRIKSGVFIMPFHPPGKSLGQCHDEDMELVIRADELGIDEFWIGEHHTMVYENIAMPEIFIGAAREIEHGRGELRIHRLIAQTRRPRHRHVQARPGYARRGLRPGLPDGRTDHRRRRRHGGRSSRDLA